MRFALYNFYDLITKVAESLLVYNDVPPGSFFNEPKKERGKREGVKKWLLVRIGKSISKRLTFAMRSLLATLPSEIILLHKKLIYVYGFKEYVKICHRNDFGKRFIDGNPYFINDLKSGYIAALAWFDTGRYWGNNKPKLENWVELYLPKGEKPYRFLMKTLLKGHHVNYTLLSYACQKWKMNQVFEDSLKLKLWIKAMSLGTDIFDGSQMKHKKVANIECLEDSSKKQIFQAKKLLEKHLRNKLDFRTRIGLDTFIRFLYDYKKEEKCQVVTLMERSIQWHLEQRRTAAARAIERAKVEKERKTSVPPIELPKTPNVKFLEDCDAVINEGVIMAHCVGGYANSAFNGHCYLFHVDYQNHMATAEVSKEGNLRQIHGPYNKDGGNKAVSYGKKVLGVWCSQLKKFLNKEKGILPCTPTNIVENQPNNLLLEEIPF